MVTARVGGLLAAVFSLWRVREEEDKVVRTSTTSAVAMGMRSCCTTSTRDGM